MYRVPPPFRLLATSIVLAVLIAAPVLAQEDGSSPGTGMVVLLTDYGSDSIYVGILKGAIYKKFPNARVDAITNAVPPYDIASGAYLLAEAAPEYPKGTVFCCVVDPGVGTERKSIAIKTNSGHYFVAPDNGLLTVVADRLGLAAIRECTNQDLWRDKVTSTVFHGRDIYGPVSASFASGVSFEAVGETLDSMVRIELPSAVVDGDTIRGAVMRADPYGNLVTTITRSDLEKLGIARGQTLSVTIGSITWAAPFVTTYANVPKGDRLVVLQSSGFVECAINQASLADAVQAEAHTPVTLKKAD
ncbi:MAG: SAM-dependent chlorinase/fluorinase [Candidatus Hydrogenedentes bacterium]|nr:SAM-dependent chlorinase/fluorinase [Candidatus Hydrogenedentota bacterium]